MSGSSNSLSAERNNHNPAKRAPTLKCSGCESEIGMAIVNVEHVVSMQDGILLVASAAVKHSSVVIWLRCEHCGKEPVHVTFDYGRDGVLVNEGHPPDYANAYRRSIKVQPLPYAQIVAIKEGMNWPAAGYNAVTHNSQHWAYEFVQNLQNATAEKVPDPPFKAVKVMLKRDRDNKPSIEILKFWNKDYNNDVTVSQMADRALEESYLKAWHYKWREVGKYKKFKEHHIRFVEVDNDAPIEHNAFYKVVVERLKPVFDVRADIITFDEQGKRKTLGSDMQMEFWEKEVTVSQMAAKAVEQSYAHDYEWRQVAQRKELKKGIEFVEVASIDPIEDGAYYRVEVVRKQKKIVDTTNVEPGQQQVDDLDQPTTSSKVPIQQPHGEAVSTTATNQNLDVNAVVGEENVAGNEHDEAANIKQENADLDDEPNNGNNDNQNGAAVLRTLEENQPPSEGSTSLDVPMANITIKQEIPDEIAQELKQEPIEPSEMDELIALKEQQPTTSSAGIKTAPPPAKRSRAEELKEKHEVEAIVKRRKNTSSSRPRSPIDTDKLPIPPGCANVPADNVQLPWSSKQVTKRKKQ